MFQRRLRGEIRSGAIAGWQWAAGDLSVRLKLIYGLGVISRAEYEDAELLMALREELNHDGNEYNFTDDEILGL